MDIENYEAYRVDASGPSPSLPTLLSSASATDATPADVVLPSETVMAAWELLPAAALVAVLFSVVIYYLRARIERKLAASSAVSPLAALAAFEESCSFHDAPFAGDIALRHAVTSIRSLAATLEPYLKEAEEAVRGTPDLSAQGVTETTSWPLASVTDARAILHSRPFALEFFNAVSAEIETLSGRVMLVRQAAFAKCQRLLADDVTCARLTEAARTLRALSFVDLAAEVEGRAELTVKWDCAFAALETANKNADGFRQDIATFLDTKYGGGSPGAIQLLIQDKVRSTDYCAAFGAAPLLLTDGPEVADVRAPSAVSATETSTLVAELDAIRDTVASSTDRDRDLLLNRLQIAMDEEKAAAVAARRLMDPRRQAFFQAHFPERTLEGMKKDDARMRDFKARADIITTDTLKAVFREDSYTGGANDDNGDVATLTSIVGINVGSSVLALGGSNGSAGAASLRAGGRTNPAVLAQRAAVNALIAAQERTGQQQIYATMMSTMSINITQREEGEKMRAQTMKIAREAYEQAESIARAGANRHFDSEAQVLAKGRRDDALKKWRDGRSRAYSDMSRGLLTALLVACVTVVYYLMQTPELVVWRQYVFDYFRPPPWGCGAAASPDAAVSSSWWTWGASRVSGAFAAAVHLVPFGSHVVCGVIKFLWILKLSGLVVVFILLRAAHPLLPGALSLMLVCFIIRDQLYAFASCSPSIFVATLIVPNAAVLVYTILSIERPLGMNWAEALLGGEPDANVMFDKLFEVARREVEDLAHRGDRGTKEADAASAKKPTLAMPGPCGHGAWARVCVIAHTNAAKAVAYLIPVASGACAGIAISDGLGCPLAVR